MFFYFKRPKAHYKTGKNSNCLRDDAPEYHSSRPDIDNLVKLVGDALNGIFFIDDALISRVTAHKLYSDKPRTEIIIIKL